MFPFYAQTTGDLGLYGPLVAFLTVAALAAGGFAKWLDARSANITTQIRTEAEKDLASAKEEFRTEIEELKKRVSALEESQAAARKLILEAIVMLPEPEIRDKLVAALAELH